MRAKTDINKLVGNQIRAVKMSVMNLCSYSVPFYFLGDIRRLEGRVVGEYGW